jgi:hypothetical protein
VPAAPPVRALEQTCASACVKRLRILRIDRKQARTIPERVALFALQTGGSPGTAPVRALEDAGRRVPRRPVCPDIDRLRIVGVKDHQAHGRRVDANPARSAVRALEKASLAGPCVYGLGVTRVDDQGLDVSLGQPPFALVRTLLAEEPVVCGAPGRTPVGGLEDPASGAGVDGLRVCWSDRKRDDRRCAQGDGEGVPATAPVRALEEARARRGREDGLGRARIDRDRTDQAALDACSRLQAGRLPLRGRLWRHLRAVACALGTCGATPVVEAEVPEQGGRGGN